MIARITKITDKLLNSSEGEDLRSYSFNLPFFDTHLDYAYQKEFSEYVIQFWKTRSKYRYPVWIDSINEDDLKKINSYWDWMIDKGIDCWEFEL